MAVQVPTLSASGWAGNISEKLDKLISYFFLSDFSQSHLYRGHVASLPYIIQSSSDNKSLLRTQTQKTLMDLLRPYFDTVQIDVTLIAIDEANPDNINLRVDATVTQDAVLYSVGREVQIVNSKVVAIFEANNG